MDDEQIVDLVLQWGRGLNRGGTGGSPPALLGGVSDFNGAAV